MLEIKRIDDPITVKEEAGRSGVEYREGLCLYTAENGGETLGVCFFRPVPEGIRIEFADAKGDKPLFDGLIRAAMSQLFDRENDRVEFSEKVDPALLLECRFVTGDGRRIESANEFFERCKNCKN